jgi:hypothetical protein
MHTTNYVYINNVQCNNQFWHVAALENQHHAGSLHVNSYGMPMEALRSDLDGRQWARSLSHVRSKTTGEFRLGSKRQNDILDACFTTLSQKHSIPSRGRSVCAL